MIVTGNKFQTAVRLSGPQRDFVEDRAKTLGISIADTIRRIIDEYREAREAREARQ